MAGRPAFKPTDDQRKMVRGMVAYGVPLEHIADLVGVTRKTLSKHFAKEIRTAKSRANAMVAESLFTEATKGKGSQKVTAAIFWLKTQAGWKETTRRELTGPDGQPLESKQVRLYVPKNGRDHK